MFKISETDKTEKWGRSTFNLDTTAKKLKLILQKWLFEKDANGLVFVEMGADNNPTNNRKDVECPKQEITITNDLLINPQTKIIDWDDGSPAYSVILATQVKALVASFESRRQNITTLEEALSLLDEIGNLYVFQQIALLVEQFLTDNKNALGIE